MEVPAPAPTWSPLDAAFRHAPLDAYDRMREERPVAYSGALKWSVFRHDDVMAVLHDPATFSNRVSERVSVPNGIDPPAHPAYRTATDLFFAAPAMAAFEAPCRRIAAALADRMGEAGNVEFISDYAEAFAVQVQCAFMGWPDALQGPLQGWARRNHAATRAQDRTAMAEVAAEFRGYMEDLLDGRRAEKSDGGDVTARLMQVRVSGKPLSGDELISILRNWTVGEIGTIAASMGILAHHLACDVALQAHLRANPSAIPYAITEMLRLHGPLLYNRRLVTRDVELRGQRIRSGETVSVIWVAANRDGRAFANPTTFQLDRDQRNNLLYGSGIHACPGAPLAQLEMRVALEELLRRTASIESIPDAPIEYAVFPASGFTKVPLHIR